MDTFLYIVVAIGIMAYQIYNEKNKKEQRQNSVNKPPVKRIDPNEELHKDLARMFGSLSMVDGLEDEELEEQLYPTKQGYKDIASQQAQREPEALHQGLASEHQGLAAQYQELSSHHQHSMAQNQEPQTPIRRKYEPEIVPTETLGKEAYNVDVPVNKTDAETKQLLQDIYDSSEISGFDSSDQSQKAIDFKGKGFDPRLFILYSEIARPKYLD